MSTTTTTAAPQTFDSWVGHETSDVDGNLKFEPVPVKPWDEDDIDGEDVRYQNPRNFAS